MKKICVLGVLVVAGVVTLNVSINSQKRSNLSAISMTNIEVLATEASGPCPNAARQWDPPAWFYDDHNFVICGSCSVGEGHSIIYGC
ncbi:MAG: hypothetical protein LBG80_07815 [Bacteroidales bacterium]|jgi:hypothetical protein|nr:hypothetical protein [Bacteroidales bacterium]